MAVSSSLLHKKLWDKNVELSRHRQALYQVLDRDTGVYKVPPPPRGEFYQECWKENQAVKRGRKYHGCGEEYNVEKIVLKAITSSL